MKQCASQTLMVNIFVISVSKCYNSGLHLYMEIWMYTEGINIFKCLQFKDTSRKHLKGMNYTRQTYFIRITFTFVLLEFFSILIREILLHIIL